MAGVSTIRPSDLHVGTEIHGDMNLSHQHCSESWGDIPGAPVGFFYTLNLGGLCHEWNMKMSVLGQGCHSSGFLISSLSGSVGFSFQGLASSSQEIR